ncbi:MAG: 2-dehydropantoate 2-reductase [Rhodospirillum sp.]|nr:2-dehydropantoate 2-reductase [Rhodospirillum sp.]MCF8487877.1 2-dehydropantoate 2-reductase [Rhodospirillum sp.]MCF8499199.1 2-dehydropantoate 2-reductase [Rhodospirillum sp.]
MRICVYGLGAIGGLLAARLAIAGHAVSAVARGATLAAVRRRGMVLVESRPDGGDRRTKVPVMTAERLEDLGPQDLVILSIKSTALGEVAPLLGAALGPETTVLSTMNGIPWWFFHGLSGASFGGVLETVDPGGAVTRALDPIRVLGCVTHLAATAPEPGVARWAAGQGLFVGEPAGGTETPRVRATVAALTEAGFDVTAVDSIQREIWLKLWGNMTMNPVSALTGATCDRILDDPLLRGFLSRCMVEAAEVGGRIGLPIDLDPEGRHAMTRQLGAFRTSMLQDADAGKPLELDALVAAVREIAGRVGVETPNIDALFGMARVQARTRGLYPET